MDADATRNANEAFDALLKKSEELDSDGTSLSDAKLWELDRRLRRVNYMSAHWSSLFRKIRHLSVVSSSIIDAFQFFSSEEYANHPWHNHSETIQKISTNLDAIISDIHMFCQGTFTFTTYAFMSPRFLLLNHSSICAKLNGDITDDEVKTRICNTATALVEVAEDIRKNILPMQGTYYSKSWAVKIAMEYDAAQRGDFIRAMISNHRIPSTSRRMLFNLMKCKKNGIFIIDDEWKSVGNNKKHGLKMALIPVKVCYRGFGQIDRRKTRSLTIYRPQIDTSFYAPPKQVCLRDYFQIEKGVRLYFSPHQFPTPMKLQYADIEESFDSLKEYIIECSKKEGEVSCNSGGKPGVSKRFSCKTKQCKFCFILKWDKYGYYIHHNDDSYKDFVGCFVHNH